MPVEICYECNGEGCPSCGESGYVKVAETVKEAVERSPGLEAFDAWCEDFLDGQGA